ncbi:hypothetical protein [Streptomyces sp. NPDC051567]|uniref:hypothetical protein n=1 Tax=Streptomyces sp. NPDC051567 TaxID=3365660 RepID=UPI0037AA19E4
MSKAAANSRQIHTGVDASGEVPIEYRFTHARNGNGHLLVVFANLTAPGEYGWANGVLDKVRSNILWIRDLFDGQNSYYLCKNMDFALERSVAGLISRVLDSLGLTPDACTLFGSSKGGSAALYFGLRYGFGNIVASVPQFQIGSYVQADMPGAAKLMMGEVTDEKVRALDTVLPDLVRRSPNRGANIYLVTSPQDEQYRTQVEPFIPLFHGYQNFNVVFNDSSQITGHGKVTLRNLPTLMGLVNMLVDGIAPRLGMVRTGGEQPSRDTSAIEAYLTATSQLKRTEEFLPPVVLSPAPEELVSDGMIRVTGAAPGAVRVSFWESGRYLASTPVAPDGSWTWDPPALGKGRHAVRLFSVDAANFQSERSEMVFTVVDRHLAPVNRPAQPLPPVLVSPGLHGYLGPAVQFTGFAPGAVQVVLRQRGTVLGDCPVAHDGGWFWDAGWAWPEGPHAVEVVALDANGSESAPAVASFTVHSVYAAPMGPGGHA